ncbi:MAG: PQQ-binding-like beta-propeller repeat protein [Tepidisphaerales bacterium]
MTDAPAAGQAHVVPPVSSPAESRDTRATPDPAGEDTGGTSFAHAIAPAPAAEAWPGWRGARRDGHVAWLPEKLPAASQPLWEKRLASAGVGGLAATADVVLVSDRNPEDTMDIWRCLDAATGREMWALRYLAQGKLDYGTSPRPTPLIQDARVFLLGAMGHLHCVELATGKIIWEQHIGRDFGRVDRGKWGYASSPLIVDGRLIVNPGAKEASLVALDPATGKTLWQSPGEPAAFASFIVAEIAGRRQLIGYDRTTLGGWDPATGKRLWSLKPRHASDFNVPTPVLLPDSRLLIATENNGTRIHAFDPAGRIIAEPLAVNSDLAPDTHTPVYTAGHVFGIWEKLYCLDPQNGLKPLWIADDPAFADYATILAADDRLLVSARDGTILLVDARAPRFKPLGRRRVLPDETGLYSHPALVGRRLYLRGSSRIVCLEL